MALGVIAVRHHTDEARRTTGALGLSRRALYSQVTHHHAFNSWRNANSLCTRIPLLSSALRANSDPQFKFPHNWTRKRLQSKEWSRLRAVFEATGYRLSWITELLWPPLLARVLHLLLLLEFLNWDSRSLLHNIHCEFLPYSRKEIISVSEQNYCICLLD